MGWEGIGTFIGKISDWIPKKREALQGEIEKVKQEMQNVQDKKPFDDIKYGKLVDRLRKLESAERRAS
jgi:hypothetical protein